MFGPVAAIIRAPDEEAAIRIANDTSFGLGAAIFTRDIERGEQIARDRLDAGSLLRECSGKVRPTPSLRWHQGKRLWSRAVRSWNP